MATAPAHDTDRATCTDAMEATDTMDAMDAIHVTPPSVTRPRRSCQPTVYPTFSRPQPDDRVRASPVHIRSAVRTTAAEASVDQQVGAVGDRAGGGRGPRMVVVTAARHADAGGDQQHIGADGLAHHPQVAGRAHVDGA